MLDVRELAVPVVCAPMAGGVSTPSLAAAVSRAGGLGFLAAGYKSADAVAAEIDSVRALASAPVAVNVFVIGPDDADPEAVDAYRRSLQPEAAGMGVDLGRPRWDDDDWRAKLDVLFDLRPDVVSFTFGCPSADVLTRLSQSGLHATVTVTTVAEAREAEARGAASLCVQGPEAGAHRGTWDPHAMPSITPTLDLVADVASQTNVPVLAAGGIVDAAGVRDALSRGASAAQVGTAFLLADEAGTHQTHRDALAGGSFTGTEVTRSFTGRWARGLGNRFMREHADAPAAYPHLHHLTAPLRAAALATGDVQVAHLWAGTGYAEARPGTAAEITDALAP